MIEVTLLGTGSPIPDADRAGPSTLVRAGGQIFLVDCGRGVQQRMTAIGVGANGAVFIVGTDNGVYQLSASMSGIIWVKRDGALVGADLRRARDLAEASLDHLLQHTDVQPNWVQSAPNASAHAH